MTILDKLKDLIISVENDKGEDEMAVENETVDKRKLIDEVGGILKGKVDDEIIRTVIGKLEKVAYDKSEAGTADNKKCRNGSEEDEEKVSDIKKELKKDVLEEGADNKKKCVKNSKPDFFGKLNEVYNSAIAPQEENLYISREQKLKAAEEYFAG